MSETTPPPPQGQMTADRLNSALESLARVTNIDTRGAELLKFTNNAVYRLPASKVVVRIAGSTTMTQRVAKVIRVARWLQDHDVPAVRLLPIGQPVMVNGLTVTIWAEEADTGPVVTGTDLADILIRIHDLSPPEGGLPGWAPLKEIRQRLEEPDGISASEITYLSQQCDQLEDELANLNYVLPQGPIHGDAFLGNVIPSPAGPVICDFDSTCIGPREWDLTPLAVGKLRFDYPGENYDALATRYGFDVIAWSGFPTLRRLRELKLVTSLVPVLGSRPTLRPQWQHRFDTYRAGDEKARWSTYSGN